jgi:hypothetical protein
MTELFSFYLMKWIILSSNNSIIKTVFSRKRNNQQSATLNLNNDEQNIKILKHWAIFQRWNSMSIMI